MGLSEIVFSGGKAMAPEQRKTTYTAAEVAVLEETILKQKAEIDELKRKLEHMNEVFANAQRARFGQSSEQKNYVLGKDQLSLFNVQNRLRTTRQKNPIRIPFLLRHMSGRRNAARQRC